MRKYLLLLVMFFVSGCAVDAELKLTDLPGPVYLYNDGSSYSGGTGGSSGGSSTVIPTYSENPPANALSWSQIDTLIKPSNYNSDTNASYKYYNYSPYYAPYFKRSFGNIIFYPTGQSYNGYSITYNGDRFVPNQYGFAEQETGAISKPEYTDPGSWDGLVRTKLVLGGGMTGMNYVDFGYWIGVPRNTTQQPVYESFATYSTAYNSKTPGVNTSYTGKAAAVAVNNNIIGSAHELGGTATLSIDNNRDANLHLVFQNYYTFDITSDYDGRYLTSVTVNGTNYNGGPTFSSCNSGCSGSANYLYMGQYQGDEAVGTYKYTSGNNVLIGSFGAKLNN